MEGAVIGAQSAWASMRERRVLGASRRRIEAAPELGVRASSGYTLFAIETPEILISAGQKLLVSNNNGTSASLRPQELVLFVKGQAA